MGAEFDTNRPVDGPYGNFQNIGQPSLAPLIEDLGSRAYHDSLHAGLQDADLARDEITLSSFDQPSVVLLAANAQGDSPEAQQPDADTGEAAADQDMGDNRVLDVSATAVRAQLTPGDELEADGIDVAAAETSEEAVPLAKVQVGKRVPDDLIWESVAWANPDLPKAEVIGHDETYPGGDITNGLAQRLEHAPIIEVTRGYTLWATSPDITQEQLQQHADHMLTTFVDGHPIPEVLPKSSEQVALVNAVLAATEEYARETLRVETSSVLPPVENFHFYTEEQWEDEVLPHIGTEYDITEGTQIGGLTTVSGHLLLRGREITESMAERVQHELIHAITTSELEYACSSDGQGGIVAQQIGGSVGLRETYPYDNVGGIGNMLVDELTTESVAQSVREHEWSKHEALRGYRPLVPGEHYASFLNKGMSIGRASYRLFDTIAHAYKAPQTDVQRILQRLNLTGDYEGFALFVRPAIGNKARLTLKAWGKDGDYTNESADKVYQALNASYEALHAVDDKEV